MRKLLLAVVAAAAFVAGGVAQAQAPARGLSQTHDGFFLQLDLGGGGMNTSAPGTGGNVELSGASGEFSIALGGAVTPNFIIGGQLWGMSSSSPDAKVGGQSVPANDVTFTMNGIGLALTYYFMPINLYVQATPSIGTLSLEESGVTLDNETGFAIRLAVGKEWWVSDNWGLGANVQYAHSSNDVKNPAVSGASFSTDWFGVAFSATYN